MTASPARVILHVDMDAFFAAVEVRDDPDLAGRPVIVGGTGPRGVVAAASYEARRHGVHSAMPTALARRRCPAGVFLPPRHERYGEVSSRIMARLADLTPLVEPLSVDEAWLDLTGSHRRLGRPVAVARRLREDLLREEGLGSSVGIAPNKFLAKLASSRAKPRVEVGTVRSGPGVLEVPAGGELAFLHPLPIADLWGVGPATGAALARLGVATVGDLVRLPPDALAATVGGATAAELHRLARGVDDRPVDPAPPRRSISQEATFPADLHRPAEVETVLVGQADRVAGRLRAGGLSARTVTVKLRFSEGFRTVTRSRTLQDPVDDGVRLAAVARDLAAGVDPGPGIRLVGLGVSGLTGAVTRQLSLADAGPGDGRDGVNRVVDEVRRRFGDAAIAPARTIDGGR